MKYFKMLKTKADKLRQTVKDAGDDATDEDVAALKALDAEIDALEAAAKDDKAGGEKGNSQPITIELDDDFKDKLKKMAKDAIEAAMPKPESSKFKDKNITILRKQVTQSEVDRFNSVGQESEKELKASRFGKLLSVTVLAHRNPDKAFHLIEQIKDEKLQDTLVKSLMSSDFDAGGSLVREDMADEVIDLLRPASVVRRSGARQITMPLGNFGVDKLTGGATSFWGEEGVGVNASQQTTGQVKLEAHKLTTIVPITNELLQFTSSRAMQIAQGDALAQMGTTEDVAFLRGTGTLSVPTGLLNQAGATAAIAGVTAANVESDVDAMFSDLEGNDVGMVRPAFFGSPRSRRFMFSLLKGSDTRLFPELKGMSPNIEGANWHSTNNIPNNLGGGADESEIILSDMDSIMIADADQFTVTVGEGVAYLDSTGTLVSGFSRNETVIRIVRHVDIIARHEEAISTLTAVLYGS